MQCTVRSFSQRIKLTLGRRVHIYHTHAPYRKYILYFDIYYIYPRLRPRPRPMYIHMLWLHIIYIFIYYDKPWQNLNCGSVPLLFVYHQPLYNSFIAGHYRICMYAFRINDMIMIKITNFYYAQFKNI